MNESLASHYHHILDLVKGKAVMLHGEKAWGNETAIGRTNVSRVGVVRFTAWMAVFVLLSSSLYAEAPREWTAEDLRQAASAGELETVEACLTAGVPVDSANAYGVTPLLLAADHKHIDVAKRLLDAGANPGTRDRFYGFTPMAWALNRQQFDLVTALAKANAPDTNQALTRNVYFDNAKAVNAILESDSVSVETIRWAAIRARLLERKERLETLINALPEGQRELPKADPDPVTAYVGFFQKGDEVIKLVEKEGSLYLQSGREATPRRLTHLAPGEFEIGLGRILFATSQSGDPQQFTRELRGSNKSVFKRQPELSEFPETENPDPEPSDSIATKPERSVPQDFLFDGMPWSGFRGHLARGIATDTTVPTTWDLESGENVAWKAPIDGLANSCPIVWQDRVYLTTAVSQNVDADGFQTGLTGDVASVDESDPWSFRLLCLDLKTGDVIWDKEACNAVPAVKRHAKSSHANPTPVTDGNLIVASFGSEGIYCFDRDGNLKWDRDLGMLDSGWFYDRSYQWGYASSPCLVDDRVIIQCDIQDQSFLTALDLETGETVWTTERDEIPTWGTPVGYTSPQGERVVVVSGTKANAAYDLDDGTLLWKLGGFSEIVAPTPQVVPWGVLLTSGYAPIKPIALVRHEARGDLTLPEPGQDEIANPTDSFGWARQKGGPYMSTPLIYEGLLYNCDTQGVLTCYDATNGEQIYKKRLRGGGAMSFTGSPVAAGGCLYFPSEQGVIQIVRAGIEFEQLDPMKIAEATLSSPAISGGYLLIRGESHLFAFKQDD
ncbi:MAG: PQQ-binding-like beta-propeller repeat protein [Planctomycetota bacterium]